MIRPNGEFDINLTKFELEQLTNSDILRIALWYEYAVSIYLSIYLSMTS